MSSSLATTTPKVISKADPDFSTLLRARAVIQKVEDFKEIFHQSKEGSSDELASSLESTLREYITEGDIPDVARYLADEYTQLGDGIFVVSTETGRITGIIREEDISIPAPVPREGSTELAQPAPTLRSDIEAAIILRGFEAHREARILATLAARGHQTDLIREMGDPRLLVATRAGRRSIVEALATCDPKALLEACGGTSAAFLQCFSLVNEDPDFGWLNHITGMVRSSSVMGVQDPTTTNLHHNRAATLRGALVQGWVREIADALGRQGKRFAKSLHVDDLGKIQGIWVAAPHLVRPIREKHPNAVVLPVACPTFCITPKAGFIKVPRFFEALSTERFDRWEASTHLDYELWYEPTALRYFKLEGIDETPQVLLVNKPR